MRFVDEVKILIRSGNGGRGCLSFRREKFIPRGGPDGGDGGDGGDVLICADSQLSTLLDYRYQSQYQAGNGQPGKGKNMHGANGESLCLRVPVGTLVYNAVTDELLADLTDPDQPVRLACGGQGGRGNARFASSTNRAPRHTQPGLPGEELRLRLELKLLADVGLVGLPNAGKSTLIRAISAARPKVADYPFTTLVPNLGVVSYDGHKSFVVADIPGLIAGASEGQGLGTRFLRHIERTDLFLHLLDLSLADDPDRLLDDFHLINTELGRHDPALLEKPQLVVLTKNDITEVRQRVQAARLQLEALGYPVFCICALTREGLDPLIRAIADRLEHNRELAPCPTTPHPAQP
ncbi:MAG: GTPase ObgE [Desulfuromonas thiophila]|nr:GTPase ObgE [Desulfuromonas thiophila]MDD3800937.1 GTPase ObgE [Desulfuromonas thiophila]